MKHLPAVAGALLGLLFIASGLVVLLKLVALPPPPEGTPAAAFMTALVPTGYMNLVKVLEVIGGLLVAIPRTRNFGLLILGPIIVNILAFHLFIDKSTGLFNPLLIFITVLAAYLLWCGRRAFLGLLGNTGSRPAQATE